MHQMAKQFTIDWWYYEHLNLVLFALMAFKVEW